MRRASDESYVDNVVYHKFISEHDEDINSLDDAYDRVMELKEHIASIYVFTIGSNPHFRDDLDEFLSEIGVEL